MLASSAPLANSPVGNPVHDAFLALLPKILTHASISFRNVHCPAQKADQIAECVALAWKWFLRLHERGKDVNDFKMVFVFLVAKAVKSGRRLTRMEEAKDVLSERAQHRHGFKVEALPISTRASQDSRYSKPYGQKEQDAFEERLRDNVLTPPPDAAAFRIDFPKWRAAHSHRDRRLIDLLMRDTSTQEASRILGVSPGRVSQKRRAFYDDWQQFHGEVIAS